MRTHRATVALVVFGVVALTVAGTACRRESQGRCGRLIKELASPAKAKEAIRQLGEYKMEPKEGEEGKGAQAGPRTCAKAIPELLKMYKDGRYRADILRAVKQMGKQEAVMGQQAPAAQTLDLVRAALTDAEGGPIAASIVEDWKLRELKDDLAKNLLSKDFVRTRLTALQALLAIVEPGEIQDLLIELVIGDADKQTLKVNVMAAQRLGMVRSEKAISNLIKGIFLRDQRGGRMYQVARRALTMIGKPSLTLLLATINGQNAEMQEYARANGIPDWEWSDGQEIMEILGDIADPGASLDIAKSLAKPLTEPARLSDKQLELWKMGQSNRIKLGMLALGSIGSIPPEGIEILKATIMNEENDVQQRLDSAMALALVGCPACVDALMAAYTASQKVTFRAALLEPLSFGLGGPQLEAFDAMIAADKNELVAKKMAGTSGEMSSAKDNVDVVRQCKDDVNCLLRLIEEKTEIAAKIADPEADDATKAAATQAATQVTKAVVLLGRATDQAESVRGPLLAVFEKGLAAGQYLHDLCRFSLMSYRRLTSDDKEYMAVKKIWQKRKDEKPNDYWTDALSVLLLSRGMFDVWEPI